MLSIPTPNVSRWWLLGSRVAAGSPTRAIGDDVIRYRPFFVTRRCQIDALALRTDGTGYDNTIRLGVYTSDENGLPSVLLGETGNLSTNGDATRTVKTSTIGMTVDLLPGRMYYAAVISRRDSGSNDTKYQVTSIGSAAGALTLGGISAAEANDELNDYGSIDHAAALWTAMPNPAVMTSPSFSNMPPAIAGSVSAGFPGEGPGHAPFVYPWGSDFKRWYVAGGIGNDTQVFALTDGAVAYVPFFVSRDLDVDRMAFEVTTLDAGGLVRLGIFDSDADGKPGSLLVETASIGTGSTGVKEAAVAVTTLLEKKTYWAALGVSGGTPAVRMFSQTSETPMITNLGNANAADATYNALRQSHMAGVGFVAGSGFGSGSGATYTSAHIRQIAFRVSTVA